MPALIKTTAAPFQGEFFKSYEFQAHGGGVASVILLSDGVLLSAGISDGNVVSWETTRMFEKKSTLKLKDGLGSVKTMALDGNLGNLFVGTNRNCILGGSMSKNFGVVVWGHDTRFDQPVSFPVFLIAVLFSRVSVAEIFWEY